MGPMTCTQLFLLDVHASHSPKRTTVIGCIMLMSMSELSKSTQVAGPSHGSVCYARSLIATFCLDLAQRHILESWLTNSELNMSIANSTFQ